MLIGCLELAKKQLTPSSALLKAGIFKKWAQIWCENTSEKWLHDRN